eukprot:1366941-Rhodomonas_salina.3
MIVAGRDNVGKRRKRTLSVRRPEPACPGSKEGYHYAVLSISTLSTRRAAMYRSTKGVVAQVQVSQPLAPAAPIHSSVLHVRCVVLHMRCLVLHMRCHTLA